jgi:hypothetical protein
MTTECLTTFDVRDFGATQRRQRASIRELVPAIVAAAAYILLLPAASVVMAFLTP